MSNKINPLQLSYPTFVLGQIINPDEANQNNSDITNKVNEFIGDVEGAMTLAENADVKSTDAINTANSAETKADDAILTATTLGNEAKNIANQANITSSEAKTIASGADTNATNALTTATHVEADYNTLKPTLEQAVIDVNNAVATIETKASVEYVNNKSVETINYVINEIDRREPVDTEADLYITYPNAEDGWICLVRSTRNQYVFNGTTNTWDIRPNEISYADEVGNDGIIASETFVEIQNMKEDFIAHKTDNTAHDDIRGELDGLRNDVGTFEQQINALEAQVIKVNTNYPAEPKANQIFYKIV